MVSELLNTEFDKLNQDILKMGRLLEEQVYKTIKSLVEQDIGLAKEVIGKDKLINNMELEIEKKALGLIALKQPMASDLRLIGTALKIIVDIERMGDHAKDIAKVALKLYGQNYIKPLIDIPRMAKVAQQMIEKALNAFIYRDVELAMSLIPMEKELDALYEQIFRELLSYMMQNGENIPQATDLLLVAGHLERIGDHATNIGEMVLYVVESKRIDINEIARKNN